MEENFRQKPTNLLKIALYGTENSGKTTLARQLAEHFNTVWIPEFARNFLQTILDTEGRTCQEHDLLPIVAGQIKLENEGLDVANRFVFCDTNSLVTKVFSDIYYKQCSNSLAEIAQQHHYDLYFLTDIDIPWENDGLRDSEAYRNQSFLIFKEELEKQNKPYLLISGTKEERLQKAIKIVSDFEAAKNAGLSSHDFVELYHQNKDISSIIHQINAIKNGIDKIDIMATATIENGIMHYSNSELEAFAAFFDKQRNYISLEKFVPASGAASRMFKFLSDFLAHYNVENETINAYINRSNNNALSTFIVAMEKLPFFEDTVTFLKKKYNDFDSFSKDKKNYLFIATILNNESFNYIHKPKAVLPFHKHRNTIATPFDEHLKECLEYASNANEAKIHFTISEEHLNYFASVSKNNTISHSEKVSFSYSFQDTTTDSITLNDDNEIVKDNFGKIKFRPGGHGALLYNLNKRNADIIFIKNIDNVSYNNNQIISFYKKSLAGILLQTQQRVFDYCEKLETIAIIEKGLVEEIVVFCKNQLYVQLSPDFEYYKIERQIAILKAILNRPIRVCGMVKNENEPGGGPFWVKNSDGSISLQIVESAQIDLENPKQEKIVQAATHFNPVDIVCGIKNYKGEKYDLLEFTNPNTGFVVEKSKDGINYKAYELPGLWNGSMANWITLFVEVSLETFNPVKTVNDLLKPAHQPNE